MQPSQMDCCACDMPTDTVARLTDDRVMLLIRLHVKTTPASDYLVLGGRAVDIEWS